MRSQKLVLASAALLACSTLATLSFADDSTTTAPNPGTANGSSSSVTTVTTPSAPATSTTITTQGTTTATPMATTPCVPTGTTTTTSADEVSASGQMPPASATPQPREEMTIYQKTRPNLPLMLTGGALFAGTYVVTAAVAGSNGPIGDHDLYIPLVGPWINLASRTCNGNCPDNTRDSVLIAGSGVLQSVGMAMVVASFFVPTKVPAARISAGNVKMQITPSAGPGGGGLGAFGTF